MKKSLKTLMDDPQDNEITVDLGYSFDPYEDKNVTETQPDVPIPNQREPFNDVVKHQDIIAGYQRNRTLSDYPRRLHRYIRLFSITILAIVVLSILWDLLHY